jgi:hypothetical protein
MAMPYATNTVTSPGNVSVKKDTTLAQPVQLPDPQPTGQDLVAQMRSKGFNKGTSNVQPTKAVAKSWRGDANGSLTAAEHAGVPHPSLAPQFKKK